jgi:hypothetical protein
MANLAAWPELARREHFAGPTHRVREGLASLTSRQRDARQRPALEIARPPGRPVTATRLARKARLVAQADRSANPAESDGDIAAGVSVPNVNRTVSPSARIERDGAGRLLRRGATVQAASPTSKSIAKSVSGIDHVAWLAEPDPVPLQVVPLSVAVSLIAP